MSNIEALPYAEFLTTKDIAPEVHGPAPGRIHKLLYPFQEVITKWAIRRGRAAIFADCGLGKTLMQLEWARQSGARVLIVAPLAVAEQTMKEGSKIGLVVAHVVAPTEDPIQITNYEKLRHFVGAPYDAIVLDESSILKSIDGKTRTMLLREFTHIPRRLCCTATPAPNDMAEMANHAEFLGVMTRPEMLATFFVHDSDIRAGAAGWRLKGHAREAFWKWVAKWACYVRKPSDLGFDDEAFRLPEITYREEVTITDWTPAGMLFPVHIGGIAGRREARRATLHDRVRRAAEIIEASPDQWLVWCGLNDEGRLLEQRLDGIALNIEGAHTDEEKIRREADWRSGKVRALITKPKIFGFGMNWQHCHRVMFLGLNDSYEQFYQAVRRCWRFGQTRPVDVRVIISEAETEVVRNVRRKETEAAAMAEEVINNSRAAMMEELEVAKAEYVTEETTGVIGDGWKMMRGDSCERIREIPEASIGLSVFSPPFASLYTYSASPRDMGNSRDYDEFFQHFGYLVPEIMRVTMPGRRCAVHVQQVTTTKATHGTIGWRDFRADVVKLFISSGWVYDGEVVIDKDPQAQAIRTKSKALMFVQKNKDSSWLRPAMADYILLFRHPGENLVPVKPDVTNEEWILWARPIWYGIRESETLSVIEARSEKDERHICPLQLETIERCIRLWSNPGETIFSPFAGIGSEGYVAVQKGRRFIGIELKPEYCRQAVINLHNAQRQLTIFEEHSLTSQER